MPTTLNFDLLFLCSLLLDQTDGRRKAAHDMMDKMGQKGLSMDGLFQILSTKPVHAPDTDYTNLIWPKEGVYRTTVRNPY